jgi:hypothetical protein
MAVKIEDLINPKSDAFLWLFMGTLYLLLNFFVVGVGDYAFPFGLLYALGFLAVAIILAQKQVGLLSGFMAALIGLLSVFTSLVLTDTAWFGAIMGIVCFGVLMADELKLLTFGDESKVIKYMMFAPFLMWFVWAASYFGARLSWGWPLPLATIVNHGGVLLLSFYYILWLAGAVKDKYRRGDSMRYIVYLKWVGFAMAVGGALWLTVGMGWGLQLV